ncbi:hypothetical protein B0H63DRAFT_97046 [Podospora didyma]|uniref:Uncharacterized protein n=1 Tax=Podospora didyma TaxID=330526 RepID=A0AAE0NXM5_9PEZI|nr:hypothetical protein B0H63DRAFT_97046 [Podospora didyma]
MYIPTMDRSHLRPYELSVLTGTQGPASGRFGNRPCVYIHGPEAAASRHRGWGNLAPRFTRIRTGRSVRLPCVASVLIDPDVLSPVLSPICTSTKWQLIRDQQKETTTQTCQQTGSEFTQRSRRHSKCWDSGPEAHRDMNKGGSRVITTEGRLGWARICG